MDVNFSDAQRQDSRAIIGLGGPNNSGKTVSALRLATGITQLTGGDILYVDTENKRALKYADSFKFKHFDFEPPFTAERYLEVLQKADKGGKPGSVIIFDSMSHEHEGMGGLLERSEQYLDEKCKGDAWKRDKLLMASQIEPKMARTRLIQNGLQRANSYIILCFRAKDKVKPIKTPYIDQHGQKKEKTEVVNLGIQIIGGIEYGHEVDVMFILPMGSQGNPAWNEEASRINDYKGDLIRALKAIPQIDEEMGRVIKNYFSVQKTDAELKDDGRAAARIGVDSLKNWWSSIGGVKQKAIGGAVFLDELKAIAAKGAPAGAAVTGLQAPTTSGNDGAPI